MVAIVSERVPSWADYIQRRPDRDLRCFAHAARAVGTTGLLARAAEVEGELERRQAAAPVRPGRWLDRATSQVAPDAPPTVPDGEEQDGERWDGLS